MIALTPKCLKAKMDQPVPAQRRRQFCARCGQLMFEYFRSPDGHFGLVNDLPHRDAARSGRVRCPTCGAVYRLLELVNALGEPIERE